MSEAFQLVFGGTLGFLCAAGIGLIVLLLLGAAFKWGNS